MRSMSSSVGAVLVGLGESGSATTLVLFSPSPSSSGSIVIKEDPSTRVETISPSMRTG